MKIFDSIASGWGGGGNFSSGFLEIYVKVKVTKITKVCVAYETEQMSYCQ